ncbi:MAG: nicotinamide riboside transporter PnuC [Bacteroidota bacterium]
MNLFDINNIFLKVFNYPISYIELIGTLSGLISVWLATKSNIWTWPIGLINVICFFAIFYQIHLYSDMFLQLYFFITSIYGWIIWQKQNKSPTLPITTLTHTHRIVLAVSIVLCTLIVGIFVKNIHVVFPSIFKHPASYPFIDTFVAILSIMANFLLARRKLENWILWIAVDVISVWLYFKKSIMLISIEYVIFLFLATLGLISWLKLINENRIGTR